MIEVLCYESSFSSVTKGLNFIPLERSGKNTANNEEQIFDCISIHEHMDKSFFMLYTEVSTHQSQRGAELMPDRDYLA